MYRISYLNNRTGYHVANPSHTKPYSETYPRKGKTQQVEGLTTRPPQSTAPPQHLKRLVHKVPRETNTHKGYRYPPPRGHTTTSESLLTNLNNNCANTMTHNNR
ncbi:hypothetical protein Taro_044053 [Colocasia esculenta]|uniref:Uncharacterized protein n=1 Tax=Colocasia esculenta TaxID=4460 RepID=A0A843X1X7_COLES|nr:hypothetical protein [Colocasia esculenta]